MSPLPALDEPEEPDEATPQAEDTEPWPDAVCGTCGGKHAGCRWTAGNLWCVKRPCANPHHRTPP